MHPGTLVICPDPLAPAGATDGCAVALGLHGLTAVAPTVSADDVAPYAARYVAGLAQAVALAAPAEPLVLVGIGESGPLLPQLSYALRAGRRTISAYVFVDAPLPRPGTPTRLDLLESADRQLAAHAHEVLHGSDATWPPEARRPRGHDFWTEPLPHPPDWPDAPCAYVASAPGFWLRTATARGWPTVTLGERTDEKVAAALARLLDVLPG